MGKKQHQKDRNFLTAKEWKEEWGGFKKRTTSTIERLPFYCCALSFTNFQDPVATADGTVYEVSNIVPYINKFKTNPVTGAPMGLGDLVPLQFHKNADDQYECPILKKVFNQFSHIVAIKTSGNVFSFEAVQRFNVKLKSWHDLITDEAFTKDDIIHIQPNHVKETAQFDHIKRSLRVDAEDTHVIRNSNHTLEKVLSKTGNLSGSAAPSSTRELALAQLEDALRQKRLAKVKSTARQIQEGNVATGADSVNLVTKSEATDWRMQGPVSGRLVPSFKPGTSTWNTDSLKEAQKIKRATDAVEQQGSRKQSSNMQQQPRNATLDPSKWWAMEYNPRYEESVQTVGHAARSFTSTTAAVTTKNELVRQLKHRCPSEKAYVTLNTNKGPLNVELDCNLVPRTCENFVVLCEMGYYTGTLFHRSIRNFMVQGGDPTGTGTGGHSIYGPTFADEFDNRLLHNRRGVLAMANHGKDTNGSQFYILYKSARHLDFKHAVFGTVVGGFETLSAFEAVSTDDEDRPREEIRITGCVIHKNPYRDIIKAEELEEASARSIDADVATAKHSHGPWFSNPRQGMKRNDVANRSRIGQGKRRLCQSDQDATHKAHRTASTDEFDAW